MVIDIFSLFLQLDLIMINEESYDLKLKNG